MEVDTGVSLTVVSGTKSGTPTTANNGVALYIHGSETPVVGTVTVRVQHQISYLNYPLLLLLALVQVYLVGLAGQDLSELAEHVCNLHRGDVGGPNATA